MARVLALLLPYYAPDVPEGIRRIDAEDWRAALGGFPHWAIEKAVRWWKSDENPDRKRKPLDGDIVERVKFDMGVLTFGAMKVREYDTGYAERVSPKEEARPTFEDMERRRLFAQDVMRNLGYAKDERKKRLMRETVTDDDRAEMAEILKRTR
jgi:hypothetical protein